MKIIQSAAIVYKGQIYTGRSHAEIGLAMIKSGVCSRPYPGGDAQGFVTNEGEFVSRITALQIAKNAGQITKEKPYHNHGLFSEDLREENP